MTTLLLLPGMDGTGTLFDPLVGALAGSVPLKVVAYPPAEALERHTTPALRAALSAALDRVSAAALRERIQAVLSVDVSADLARLRIPVLHLSASEDRLVPRHASTIVKRFQPSTRFVELAGPHGLLQAAPEEAGRVIREFVGVVCLQA